MLDSILLGEKGQLESLSSCHAHSFFLLPVGPRSACQDTKNEFQNVVLGTASPESSSSTQGQTLVC